MAKEKKVEAVEPKEEVIVEKHDDFVTRKLKAINSMVGKPEQAEKLAHRLLRKARNN